MSRRKQGNPQQMQENKTDFESPEGDDCSAKSNNFAEKSMLDEKQSEFVKSKEIDEAPEALDEMPAIDKLSHEEKIEPSQMKTTTDQNKELKKLLTEESANIQDSSCDNSSHGQVFQSMQELEENSPEENQAPASLLNGELCHPDEDTNASNLVLYEGTNSNGLPNTSIHSSGDSDTLDDSGRLCIAENDDVETTLGFEEKKESDVEDLNEVAQPPPLQKQRSDASTSSLSECENQNFDNADVIRTEGTTDPKPRSLESEVEKLRNQVGVMQQQNNVHMQMIHYILTQINYLRNQKNFVNGNSSPPNGMQFNPFLHLMSYNNQNGLPDQGPVNQSAYVSPYSTFNGFTQNSSQMARKSMSNEPVKLENEVETAIQDQKLYGDRLQSILNVDKRFENNGNPTANLNGNFSKLVDSTSLKNEHFLASSGASPASAPLGSSPPNFQTGKLLKNQCRICGKVLSCGSALKLHHRTHTGERPYSCDLCPRAFTTRGNLRTHYSSVHHRELPPASSSAKRSNGTKAKDKLSCPICSCICDNNDVLSQHMQLHVTKDQNLLALHQCLQQSAMRMPAVLAPGKTAPNGHDLTRSYPYEARNGPTIFAGKNPDLIREEESLPVPNKIRKQETKDDNSSKALDLSAGALSQQRGQKNEDVDDESELPPYDCKESSEKAEKENFIQGNLGKFSAFTRAQYMHAAANGVQALDNHSPRYYACRVCSRRFQCEEELNEHLLSHNNLEEGFSTLKQVSENRTSMKRTIEQELTNAQDAKKLRSWCDTCKKQFSSASSLAIHMRTHTGEKPYTCNVCHRSFTTRGNLKVHMNVHEYGAGGTRRGRRISGSKKPTNGDMIADARFSEASSVNTNGLRSNEATFALIQQYAALARSMANGNNQSNDNTQPAWMEPIAAAQALQQQQQQYLRSLAVAADSPAVESSSSEDRQNLPSSPEEDAQQESTASNGEPQQEVELSSDTANAANKDWLLQMFQKTRGQIQDPGY